MEKADPRSPDYEGLKPPHPKWHTCTRYPGGAPCGQILISFDIVSPDHEFGISLDKIDLCHFIPQNYVSFEIQVLGLRNLQSIGILPVQKATLTFNFQNLLPPNHQYLVDNVSTDPGPSGANPTFITQIKHKVPLPIDRILCPSLQCVIKDNIFIGVL